jgi:hypothetical protein
MKTKTLQQTVTFKASPRQVYDMLMDSKKHRSLSGQRAKISRKVGGKFTAWGSHISGYNLARKPGPDNRAGGSRLKFTQIGIPPSRYSGHYRGWIEAYWTPMKEIFTTGTISQRTKDRVKIDRQQRIKTGRFRRSISNQA